MSIICSVYVPEGIVMAADSRITTEKATDPNDPAREKTVYTSSDNAQKLVLIQKAGVGVSFCGEMRIAGMTGSDFIRRFDIERVWNGDTIEVIAKKLSEKLVECNGMDTCFYVCGYRNDLPYVYQVYGGDVKRYNIKGGADGTPLPETIIQYGMVWNGKKTAITKLFCDEPRPDCDFPGMPLKDAIDLAEYLVDTTIKYERFSDEIQTCGGDIDILVITKDEAFWHQHKIYKPKR